jgi:hypothetical protein
MLAMDPRLAAVLLGGLLIVSGLVWIGLVELGKAEIGALDQTNANWTKVAIWILQHVPPEYFVAFLLIVLGAATAVGAVWTAPAFTPSTVASSSR